MPDTEWIQEKFLNIQTLATGIGLMREGGELSANSSIVALCENIIELSQENIKTFQGETE